MVAVTGVFFKRGAGADASINCNATARIKPYRELTIADDFVFGKIFQNKAPFKRLLEILAHLDPATDISTPITQRSFRIAPDRKRIATDVSAYSNSTEFDVEMQKQVRSDLARRARYYQAAMDVHYLQSKLEYTHLKENYIVFICLHDGTTKIFYNAQEYAKLQSEEARAFMEYVSTNTATSPYTATLDELVEDLRSNPLWCKEYLCVMQDELIQQNEQKRREQAAREEGEHNALVRFAAKFKAMGHSDAETAEFSGLPLAEVEKL